MKFQKKALTAPLNFGDDGLLPDTYLDLTNKN